MSEYRETGANPTVCSQCGKSIRSGALFCPYCGEKVRNIEARAEEMKASMPPNASEALSPSRKKKWAKAGIIAPQVENRRSLIIKAVTNGLTKSLLLSAAVLGPGIILINQGKLIPGMLWLFAGSFGMMAWTYRKPWRLVMLTCLLPPGAALASYSVQLILFGKALPPPLLLLIVAGLGLLIGFWRARSHEVYVLDGSVFAQRTTRYLVIWIVAYAGTQVLGAMAQSVFLVAAGLLTGAYTTAMLLTVSVVLLRKRTRLLGTTAS